MSETISVWVDTRDLLPWIRADYSGGAYIELAFTGGAPSEVINVWDYAAGRPVIPFTAEAVTAAVQEWMVDTASEGWDSWHADYIENAR